MPAFSHLPCEIFKEIMLYTYPYIIPEPEEQDDPQLDLQVLSPPIVASHVCRSWRRTLLSDSTMWTCLSIPEAKSDELMELLRRSGSSSLNVFIKLKFENYHQLQAYADTNVLSILFQEMRRFKVLHIQIDHYDPYSIYISDRPLTQQILSSLEQPAPQLQTFYFRNSDHSIDQTFLDALFSGDAPNLKSIYYLPPDDFLEVNYPLFHNLSELYLAMPCSSTLDSDRFLDLLELSPRLKLLSFEFGRNEGSIEGSWRVVDLPCLQRLVLATYLTTDIVEFILECVKVPSTFKWSVSSHLLDLAESPSLLSPSLLRLVSQAHFASLDIELARSGLYITFEEQDGIGSHYTNQFDNNRLVHSYHETSGLLEFWEPLVDSIVSSTITRLELAFQYVFREDETMLSTIFGTIDSLEFLTFRHVANSYNINDLKAISVCLSVLVPNPEQIDAFGCRPSMENPVPDPDLDSISTDSEDDSSTESSQSTLTSEGTSSYRSIPAEAFPCPRLRELTVATEGQLDMTCAVMLRLCYTRRQEEGHPLKIFVHCPGMKEKVASILQLGENCDIYVSSDPLD